eukprot:762483-Hanusia_phi.AAC.3
MMRKRGIIAIDELMQEEKRRLGALTILRAGINQTGNGIFDYLSDVMQSTDYAAAAAAAAAVGGGGGGGDDDDDVRSRLFIIIDATTLALALSSLDGEVDVLTGLFQSSNDENKNVQPENKNVQPENKNVQPESKNVQPENKNVQPENKADKSKNVQATS